MKKFLQRKIENKTAEFFFHADLNRKKPLIQPNRSAEFFCANLRKPFFTPPRRIRRKKNAGTFAGFLRVPPRRVG
jgi:hypothetical protein